MNERITELAKQANVTYQNIGHKYSKSMYVCNEKELEKFAESIVKDCCDILNTFDCQFEIETIKDYFGVNDK